MGDFDTAIAVAIALANARRARLLNVKLISHEGNVRYDQKNGFCNV